MNKTQKTRKYFNQKEKLTLKNKKYFRQVKWLVDFMLNEDTDKEGDITSNALFKNNQKITAIIRAKQAGIVAGIEEIRWLLKSCELEVISYKKGGDKIKNGDTVLKLTGGVKTILKLERTILNILQRMSGIATQTARLTKLCPRVLICPTRKTQWGLLDKKAVTVGGGGTHRLGLYDWILIKDNHLKISNFEFSRREVRDPNFTSKQIPHSFWEIEVKNEKELKKAIALKPDVIMFDNFKPNQIKKLIKTLHKTHPQIIFEASGGINEETIKNYSQTGVDVISLGALTHSTKALDISLDII